MREPVRPVRDIPSVRREDGTGLGVAADQTLDGIGQTTSQSPVSTLPGGGTRIFPDHRLVGYSGYPGSPALGRLGVGTLDDRAAEITTLAGQYAAGRRPLPVFELIATVVHAKPGPDGLYRTRIDQEVVRRHLDAARRHGAILLLNIQPGRAAFLDEVVAEYGGGTAPTWTSRNSNTTAALLR